MLCRLAKTSEGIMMLPLQDATPDASSTQSLRSFTASMQRKEKAAQSKQSMVRQQSDAVLAYLILQAICARCPAFYDIQRTTQLLTTYKAFVGCCRHNLDLMRWSSS